MLIPWRAEVALKYVKGNCFQQDPVKTGIFVHSKLISAVYYIVWLCDHHLIK